MRFTKRWRSGVLIHVCFLWYESEITLRSNPYLWLAGRGLFYSEIHKYIKKWCIDTFVVRWNPRDLCSFLCEPLRGKDHFLFLIYVAVDWKAALWANGCQAFQTFCLSAPGCLASAMGLSASGDRLVSPGQTVESVAKQLFIFQIFFCSIDLFWSFF